MANVLTKEQVDQFLQQQGIATGMSEADTMAAINANPNAAASFQSMVSQPQSQVLQQPQVYNPTSTRTKAQVDQFLQSMGIPLNMSEAETMAAINANPSIKSTYEMFANPNANPADLEEALYQNELAKQKDSLQFGRLAENSYKDFTPYAGEKPDFVPFSEKLFKESPDYQFRLDEGNKAIDRASAARGNFYSGKALKDATDFNSNLAANEYNNARDNYNQDYSTNYGRFVDSRNNYNQDFNTAYNQADRNDSTLFNRLSTMGGTGAINTGINANNDYLSNQTGVYGATAQIAGAAGAANNNNFNRTAGNLSSRFGNF